MNWYGDLKKVGEFIKQYYWVAGIPFLIWAFFASVAEKDDIEKNRSETYGIVYGSIPIYKKASKKNFKYKFNFKGIEYTGSTSGPSYVGIRNGNIYKVVFSNKNPKHSKMDFEIEYSMKIRENDDGKIDTIYVPFSEILIEIPESVED